MELHCTLNGTAFTTEVDGDERLLDILRLRAGLTGTKEGCGEGECGACAILLDGQLVNSCLLPVGQVQGRSVQTVEGLDADAPLLRAFTEAGATQCGICTPGMLLAATALLAENPAPDLAAIRAGLAGNLCRCTGYARIYAAVDQAARLARTDATDTGATDTGDEHPNPHATQEPAHGG